MNQYNEQWLLSRGFTKGSDGEYRKHQVGNPRETSELESDSFNAALAAPQAKKRDTKRVLVRITSFRRRLLDEDNLCEKYHVDCCRYAGLLSGDEPGKTKIEVAQEKVGKGENEYTRIEII